MSHFINDIELEIYKTLITIFKIGLSKLTGSAVPPFFNGIGMNFVNFQFSNINIPPKILPTVSLFGPVSIKETT